MENNINVTKPVKPITAALNFGIIFGVLLIVIYVVSYTLNFNPQEAGGIAIINALANYLILPFTFTFLACNQFKKLTGGYISFGEAIKTGVVVCVIAAIVLGVFNIIFNLIFPEVLEEMMQKAKENMAKQPGMTSEQLKMSMKVAGFFMKPYVLLPMSILMYAFIGLINSLIVGAIVKKENPYGPFSPNQINNIGTEE